MKTITINKTELNISAAEQRALGILADHDFAAPLSAFEEGRSWRYKKFILPRFSRAKELGIETVSVCHKSGGARERRINEFFTRHPRSERCVTGSPRRVNLILAKCGGALS